MYLIIVKVYHSGTTGQTYNIGGRTNLQIVDRICTISDQQVPKEISYKELITFVEDRAGQTLCNKTRKWAWLESR